jgi:hypothetical protein
MDTRDKPTLLILTDFGEEFWTIRLYRNGQKVSDCAFAPEEKFPKKYWDRKELINVCKKICKQYGWVWSDINGEGGEEVIDYENKTAWFDGEEFKLDSNGDIIV